MGGGGPAFQQRSALGAAVPHEVKGLERQAAAVASRIEPAALVALAAGRAHLSACNGQ